MASKVHHYALTIVEAHLDTFGHVNNATYLQLFEQARWQWITDGGYGLADVHALRQGPTIVECRVKWKRELTNRTPVVIQSWVESYVGKIARVRQDMLNQDMLNQDTLAQDTLAQGAQPPNAVCCEAEFLVGLFDTAARRLIEPTDRWLASVGLAREDWRPR